MRKATHHQPTAALPATATHLGVQITITAVWRLQSVMSSGSGDVQAPRRFCFYIQTKSGKSHGEQSGSVHSGVFRAKLQLYQQYYSALFRSTVPIIASKTGRNTGSFSTGEDANINKSAFPFMIMVTISILSSFVWIA